MSISSTQSASQSQATIAALEKRLSEQQKIIDDQQHKLTEQQVTLKDRESLIVNKEVQIHKLVQQLSQLHNAHFGSTGYYTGHFNKPWLNIAPSHNLAFLRFGEFHQIKDNKVVASQNFLGITELIIALGRWSLSPSQGYEGVVPGPATQDGIEL